MKLSIIILTKNSAEKLEDCLKSVRRLVEDLAQEIILLDGGSTDKTLEIGGKYGARIIKQKQRSFNTWRNQGKEVAREEWLFYIDPDERVTPELKKEIKKVVNLPDGQVVTCEAYAIPRRNFVFGKELKHGGWWPDYVVRLMKKEALIRWEGELHEQPKIIGEIGYLKNPFIHLKEDNLSDMVKKTNKWSEIEAKLLLDSGHPQMTWWRFFRPVLTEIFDRLILKLGFLDGGEGIIFSVYQGYSVFMRYAKLWEMQNK